VCLFLGISVFAQFAETAISEKKRWKARLEPSASQHTILVYCRMSRKKRRKRQRVRCLSKTVLA